MKKILLSMVVAAAACGPLSARTTALTYAGELMRYDAAAGTLTPCTNVTVVDSMTVTLYALESVDAPPLWRRVFTNVPLCEGGFAVRLSGASAPGCEHATLDDLLEKKADSSELWVGLSDIVSAAKPGTLQPQPARGRLTAVPFALEAERATRACGAFRVSGGAAKVNRLAVSGDATVNGTASFRGPSVFSGQTSLAALDVSGPLVREELAGVAEFDAGSIGVNGVLTASDAITASSATFLPSTWFRGFSVASADCLRPKASVASGLSAGTLTVAGNAKVSRLDWTGSLSFTESPIADERRETTPVRVVEFGKPSKMLIERIGNALKLIFTGTYEESRPIAYQSLSLDGQTKSCLCAAPIGLSGAGTVACFPVLGSNTWTHVSGNRYTGMTLTVLVPLGDGEEELHTLGDAGFSLFAPHWRELSK